MKLRDMLQQIPGASYDDGPLLNDSDADEVIRLVTEWLSDQRVGYERKRETGDTLGLLIDGLRSGLL